MTSLVRSIAGMFSRSINLDLNDFARMMDMVIDGAPTYSGAVVSERTALQIPALWACVDLISRIASILPGHVYRRVTDGSRDREMVPTHYLYPLVHDQANETLPAMEWRRLCLSHLLTWGNHYSWIEWTIANKPKALWVIPPDRVRVKRASMTAPIEYAVLDYKTHQWVPFPSTDILHIRGLGFDGTMGYSPVGMLRETLGLGYSNLQSAAAMHKNGITSRLVLEYPAVLDDQQMEAFKKSFADAYQGLQNAHKAIVLQNGMKATPISINPQDAQFLETWKYNDAKIYQIYGVPPHLVGDTEKATSWGTGIEQQTIGFITFTMLPWMDLIETWLALKLLPDDQRTHFVEYDFKGLLRGDSTARANWHKTMIDIGASSPNDVLRAENEQPYPGGNVYRRPLNTAFVDADGKVMYVTPPSAKEPQDGGVNEDAAVTAA